MFSLFLTSDISVVVSARVFSFSVTMVARCPGFAGHPGQHYQNASTLVGSVGTPKVPLGKMNGGRTRPDIFIKFRFFNLIPDIWKNGYSFTIRNHGIAGLNIDYRY